MGRWPEAKIGFRLALADHELALNRHSSRLQTWINWPTSASTAHGTASHPGTRSSSSGHRRWQGMQACTSTRCRHIYTRQGLASAPISKRLYRPSAETNRRAVGGIGDQPLRHISTAVRKQPAPVPVRADRFTGLPKRANGRAPPCRFRQFFASSQAFRYPPLSISRLCERR